MTSKPSKPCQRCGREMTWRKKWAKTWDEVRYCSDACRRGKLTATDTALTAAILHLLESRAADSSACPSEAARAVSPADWAKLMEPARRAGRRLAQANIIEVTQGGRPVDPSSAKGPIRYRRGTQWRRRAAVADEA